MAASGADRVRAAKLRKRIADGDELSEDESAWFASYEDAKRPAGAVDASATERITYTEERSAAIGDHPHPESYAAIARAEGLRADTLLRIAADALVRCNEQYAQMMRHLLERTTAIETAHVSMLEAVRTHYLGRVQAEGEAQQLAAALSGAGEPESELAQLAGYILQAMQLRQEQAKKPKPRKPKKPLGAI